MKCPFCSAPDTRVINSRPAQNGEIIRRRRECDICKGRFTTLEQLEKPVQTVVKRDGSRTPFQRERLLRGIEKACKKRPITQEQIDGIVAAIEKEAFGGVAQEVPTEIIGRLVLKNLKEVDSVAYLRFASVYKQFSDVDDFDIEIKSLRED